MIRYEFFEQNRFVIIKYSGNIDMATLVLFLETASSKIDKTILKKVLMDFREASLIFDMDDLAIVSNFRLSIADSLNNVTSVFLVRNVTETVYTTLLAESIPKHIDDIHIYSTVNSANSILHLDITNKDLEYKIENLAFQF